MPRHCQASLTAKGIALAVPAAELRRVHVTRARLFRMNQLTSLSWSAPGAATTLGESVWLYRHPVRSAASTRNACVFGLGELVPVRAGSSCSLRSRGGAAVGTAHALPRREVPTIRCAKAGQWQIQSSSFHFEIFA